MQFKKFQRRIENFICERCANPVQGNGYTNHCPNCLWSKHVDNSPGDRLAQCKSMMEPTGLELHDGEQVILHRCCGCRLEKRNKISPNDNWDAIISISRPRRGRADLG